MVLYYIICRTYRRWCRGGPVARTAAPGRGSVAPAQSRPATRRPSTNSQQRRWYAATVYRCRTHTRFRPCRTRHASFLIHRLQLRAAKPLIRTASDAAVPIKIQNIVHQQSNTHGNLPAIEHTPCLKKTAHFCFCQNF